MLVPLCYLGDADEWFRSKRSPHSDLHRAISHDGLVANDRRFRQAQECQWFLCLVETPGLMKHPSQLCSPERLLRDARFSKLCQHAICSCRSGSELADLQTKNTGRDAGPARQRPLSKQRCRDDQKIRRRKLSCFHGKSRNVLFQGRSDHAPLWLNSKKS